MELREILDRLLSVLYPQRCVFCGEVVEYDVVWCGRCNPPKGDRDSLTAPTGVEDIAAPFLYEDRIRRIILRLKETRTERYLRFLAEGMAREITGVWPEVSFDLLVPVPGSKASLQELGFSQAEQLAVHLAEISALPVAARALSRRDGSKKQRTLTAEERRLNAAASYELEEADALAGKTVLLVDDVVTTGSTLSACAALLREAGAAAVYAVTAAHTAWNETGPVVSAVPLPRFKSY